MIRRLLPLLAALVALALPSVAQAAPLSWSGAVNIDGTTALMDVSCPSRSLCVAVDSAPFSNVLASTDPTGGAGTWTADPVGQNNFQSINSVSCPSVSLCVAVDNVGWVYWSTDPANGVWSDTAASINGGGTLRDIACPTASLCVAGGNAGNIAWSTNPTGGAAAWTQTNIAVSQLVLAIDCPTVALCVATDDTGTAYNSTNPTGGALAWNSTAISADVVRAMSCASATLCVAGDDGGQVISTTNPTGGLGAWTGAAVSGAFMNSVSCPATSLCVAADSSARVYEATNPTGGAAAWSTTILASQVRGIDCPSTGLCVGVGSSGNAYFGTQGRLTVSLAGTGSGSVAGSGIACPGTCSATYPGNTSVTLTPTAAAGSTFTGWSGSCSGSAGCTVTMAADRAVTATFSQDAVAPVVTEPVAAPSGTVDPTPTPTALPPPVVAQSVNAFPVKPGVRVKVPGAARFVPLSSPEQIQLGAVIDARKGRVRLVIANGKGGTDAADFYAGMFRIVQRRARVPIAELVLVGGSFRRCPKRAARRTANSARKRPGKSVRHLWGEGKGAFRTKGRNASATIRGTRWLTDDRCNGTLARVTAGSVTVRDLVKRKSLVLRAPRRYFASR